MTGAKCNMNIQWVCVQESRKDRAPLEQMSLLKSASRSLFFLSLFLWDPYGVDLRERISQ